jgi:N-acetylmuramoyl-L-alanine amidase
MLDRPIRRSTGFASSQLVWNGLISGSAIGLLILGGIHSVAMGQPPSSSSSPSTSPTTASEVERPILRLGSQGSQVSEIQAMLRLLGYYSSTVDGFYQESTAIAVSTFQQAAGLEADGVVGRNTWNRLLPAAPVAATGAALAPSSTPASEVPTPGTIASADAASATASLVSTTSSTNTSSISVELPVLRLGMRGSAVARLQERLRATGFFRGAIDGVFGAETQAAVRNAQSRYQLEPDGIVGAATWTALLR